MSDSLKTSLSAFVDGEASTEESSHVLTQLSEDEDMRTEWENYHTIATVLRNEEISGLQTPPDWDVLAKELPASGDVSCISTSKSVQINVGSWRDWSWYRGLYYGRFLFHVRV